MAKVRKVAHCWLPWPVKANEEVEWSVLPASITRKWALAVEAFWPAAG